MDPSPRPKVGLMLNGFIGLAGAADFFVSLADAMNRTRADRELVIVYQHPPRWFSPRRLAQWAKRTVRALWRGGPIGSPAATVDPQAVVAGLVATGMPLLPLMVAETGPAALELLCQECGIDVLMASALPLGPAFPVPWVGYIYDFQHRALPQYFPASERRNRDRHFARLLTEAPLVVCNSRAVKADAERYVPEATAELVPLPFSAMPAQAWLSADPRAAREKFGIGPRYFLISNQFWVHKRHDTAIAALAELARDDASIELVCTGATDDWRVPDYFAGLMDTVEREGLQDRVHILGLIDKLDQIALMRGAVAVVQPTSFEGGPGGGSVFDAVALGVPTLVSDIPVNREIEEYVTRYFTLGDAGSLADAMRSVLAFRPVTPSVAELIEAGVSRREAMGRTLWRAAETALAAAASSRAGARMAA